MLIEGNKVFDGFKEKLKHSLHTIEGQLQLKVDQMSLESVIKKVEKKLGDELKQKIGLGELRKNNFDLSKKIDGIQTKITQTLVDTLIELQSEEAPLILKLNHEKGKCGSCDQPIKENVKLSGTRSHRPFKNLAGQTLVSVYPTNFMHTANSSLAPVFEGLNTISNIKEAELLNTQLKHKYKGSLNNPKQLSQSPFTNSASSIDIIAKRKEEGNISSRHMDKKQIESDFSDERKKFGLVLIEELDKVNVSSIRIKQAANQIIEKKEKMVKKER